jgi:hypothetical protein
MSHSADIDAPVSDAQRVAREFIIWATENEGAGSASVVDWAWFAEIARKYDPEFTEQHFPRAPRAFRCEARRFEGADPCASCTSVGYCQVSEPDRPLVWHADRHKCCLHAAHCYAGTLCPECVTPPAETLHDLDDVAAEFGIDLRDIPPGQDQP